MKIIQRTDAKFDNTWNETLTYICIEENYDNTKYMIIKKNLFSLKK